MKKREGYSITKLWNSLTVSSWNKYVIAVVSHAYFLNILVNSKNTFDIVGVLLGKNNAPKRETTKPLSSLSTLSLLRSKVAFFYQSVHWGHPHSLLIWCGNPTMILVHILSLDKTSQIYLDRVVLSIFMYFIFSCIFGLF